MLIDNDVSDAEIVKPDRVQDLLDQLIDNPGSYQTVGAAFDRERSHYTQELEALRRGFSIPPTCMAAANVVVAQIMLMGHDSEDLTKIREDEGALEALVIQQAHLITKIIGWREVSDGVSGALRELDRIAPEDQSYPVKRARGLLKPLVEQEALES